MFRLLIITLALSLGLITQAGSSSHSYVSPIRKALVENGYIAPSDSVDSIIWSKANVESLILHRDSGPFEKGDSISLHKTFYVLGYRIVSNPNTRLLSNQNYTYRNYNLMVLLISEDYQNVFKISEYQFGFPPSFNSTVSKCELPQWFPFLRSELPEPEIFWRSNIFGLKFFD